MEQSSWVEYETMCSLCSNWWNMELNSVYIMSKNAARHIKKAFQRQSFSWGQRGGGSLKDEEETSVMSLTTMSSETALAITNQKTIKDENKDKLKGLCHGKDD